MHRLGCVSQSADKKNVRTNRFAPDPNDSVAKKYVKKKSGQILILMAMMSTTLIIFFGMVVSVGHLVQARVNLQNSVDLAAMVGASYQARYLSSISIINYRMRQNFKFVLSDLYVTQSRFNKGWQDAVGAGPGGSIDLAAETVGICQQAPGYRPTTDEEIATGGRAFPETNLCKHLITGHAGIPHIRWTPVFSANPIVQAINLTNLALSEDFKKTCDEARDLNGAYFEYAMDRLKKRNENQVRLMAEVLVNFTAAFSRSKDQETVGNSKQADIAIRGTFRQNLISANAANFESDGTIEYIGSQDARTFNYTGNPAALAAEALGGGSAGNFSNYFDREQTSVTINVVDFNNTGGSCRAEIRQAASGGIFLGLMRSRMGGNDPELDSVDQVRTPFHIVLRARVRPNILFWPRGLTPYITAVGAAKPFGSRIGPRQVDSNEELNGGNGPGGGGNIANIKFFPGDPSGNTGGFAHRIILRKLLGNMPPGALASGDPFLRPHIGSAPEFTQMSLAPTLYEGLMWSIYPFPKEQHSRGPADVAAFPVINLGLDKLEVREDYSLKDRGFPPSPADMWHETSLDLGKRDHFRVGNKPKFYADPTSAASAFNPELQNPSKILDHLGRGDLSGRTGYQIKLTSIKQICNELRNSIGVNQAMSDYCDDPNLRIDY